MNEDGKNEPERAKAAPEPGKNEPEPEVAPEVGFDEDDPPAEYDVEFSMFGPGAAGEEGPKGPPALAGRYQLVELLGGGAMGEIWKARDLERDDDVAVKI